ncbi:MAG: cobalamin-dependent protein [Pseudomonadota bacterium]
MRIVQNAISENAPLRQRLAAAVAAWQESPPTRAAMVDTAKALMEWRERTGATGLWDAAPRMVTATVDDGMGQGLDLIHRFARLAGVDLHPLGLMVPVADIVAACRHLQPAWLGMTVLQFDSEPFITGIRAALPASVRIIAGGPLFKADPDLAARCGIDTVLPSAAAFAAYLLAYGP